MIINPVIKKFAKILKALCDNVTTLQASNEDIQKDLKIIKAKLNKLINNSEGD